MSNFSKSSLAKLEKLLGKSLDDASDEELLRLSDEIVDKARAGLETDLLSRHDLVEGLELRGKLHRYLGHFEKAREDYTEALSLLKDVEGVKDVVGRVCAGLAVSCELSGDAFKAKSYYKGAIKTFGELESAPILEIADLNNNLAFIYEAEEKFDKAETCFLEALKLAHGELGANDRQTAVFFNNTGSFYFKLGHDERAREMHEAALKTRLTLFGEAHIETAQSYANLALVFVRSGEVDKGLASFESALTGFESDLDESEYDYEIVSANYRDVLESLGDEKAIRALDQRLRDNN